MFESFIVPKELVPSDPRFGVGPSLIPNKHLDNLCATQGNLLGTSHRKKAAIELGREIQTGLSQYFKLPEGYEVVFGNGGATFLFDMIGLGLVRNKSYHYCSGEFSHKWLRAHGNIPWIETSAHESEYGTNVNPKFIDGFDMICTTLNETSTGVMFTELEGFTDADMTDVLLAVDATSGGGQVKIDFNQVDVYFFSPQKVFASEGGFYVCILSPKAIKRAYELMQRDSYRPEVMSWKHAIENSRKSQTYNTPALSTMFLLNEQIKELNILGEEQVIKKSKAKADILYNWAIEKPYLSCFVQDQKFRSHCVATIDVDNKYPVSELTKVLREQGVILDIDGYRKLGRNQLRISLFHNVAEDDLVKLTKIISLAIESSQ